MYARNNYFIELDILRAIGAILIVLSHLQYYTERGSYQSILEFASGFFALAGLSLFFFASGFLLEKNYKDIKSNRELKDFYKKRLARVYPLFLIALIVWSIEEYIVYRLPLYNSAYKFALSIFIFLDLEGSYGYGWFVGVILLYYFIFPFLAHQKTVFSVTTAAMPIIYFFFLLHVYLDIISISFFVFYGTFILGIIVSRHDISKRHLAGIFIAFLLISIICFNIYLQLSLADRPKFLQGISGIISPLGALISYLIVHNYGVYIPNPYIKLFSKISFASYSIYLFQGIIFYLLAIIIRSVAVGNIFNISLLIAGFIAIFGISFIIQILEGFIHE